MKKENYIYYFGYGANMSVEYLQNRRRVFPSQTKPCKLNGFKLIMNMEGPNFLEPSFANIIKDKKGSLEGILHRITNKELKQIINSEGENYEVTDIIVNINSTSIKAKTLIYKTNNKANIPPSKRYMKILIEAAINNGLSYSYIQKLKEQPYVYFPVLSEIFSIFIFFWVRTRSKIIS